MENYSYIPLYISTPCQVKYYDIPTQDYKGGIVYKDELIMGDGNVVPADDYSIMVANKTGILTEDVIIPLSWVDLSEYILYS